MPVSEHRSSLKAQLARGVISALGIRILSLVAALLSSVLLARILGSEYYGLYVFTLSIATLLSLPVQMGVPTLVLRETASAEAAEDWVALNSIGAWAFRVNLLFGTMMVGGILLFDALLGGDVNAPSRQAYLMAAILIMPMALCSSFSALLRGLRRVTLGLFPQELLRPVLVMVFISLAAYLTAGQVPVSLALALNLMATVCVLLLLAALVRHAWPAAGRTEKGRVYYHRSWLRALLPLAMMSGMHLINQNTDIVMLGLFRESAEVGYYKVAASGAGLVIFGLSAVQVVAMPYVSRFYRQGEQSKLQRIATLSAWASVLLGAPLVVIYLFWGRELLSFVYGPPFAMAWEPLMILCAAQLINGCFGIVWPVLVMTGHEKAGTRSLVMATLLNVVMNALLVPSWGVQGAAVATGLSILTWNLLFWLNVKKLVGIDASLLGLLPRRFLHRRVGH